MVQSEVALWTFYAFSSETLLHLFNNLLGSHGAFSAFFSWAALDQPFKGPPNKSKLHIWVL
jgi:hypothetical protein